MEPMEVGVFLCSTGIYDPLKAIGKLKELGIRSCQLPPLGEEWLSPEKAEVIKKALAEAGIEPTTQFVGFDDESYASMAAVEETVGFLSEARRPARIELTKKIIDFAAIVGAPAVAAHIGFVPEDASDPRYVQLIETVRELCDACAARGLKFSMETGQETAEDMREFITTVNRPNLGVNFDPANMILYGKDRPIEAVGILAPWIVSVHCKDGTWPTAEGMLGSETPLGEGQVDIPAFIAKLKEIGYTGPLTIEREAGDDRIGDITRGKALLESLR